MQPIPPNPTWRKPTVGVLPPRSRAAIRFAEAIDEDHDKVGVMSWPKRRGVVVESTNPNRIVLRNVTDTTLAFVLVVVPGDVVTDAIDWRSALGQWRSHAWQGIVDKLADLIRPPV